MGDKQKVSTIFGVSQFDLIVIGVVLGLIGAVVATYVFNRPLVRDPMIAYLYPASGDVPNVWVAPLADPDNSQQVTFTNIGVYDFAVDSNHYQIAYTMRDEVTLNRDIYVLDLETNQTERVTFCGEEEAECFAPVFHPEDNVIAYVRRSTNDARININNALLSEHRENETPEEHAAHTIITDGSRIWVLDLATEQSQLLTTDETMQGHSPLWSSDGDTIAYYNTASDNLGVMVYNFAPNTDESRALNFVPTYHGSTGSLSADGNYLLIPDITNRGNQFFTFLKMIDFSVDPATIENFTEPNAPTDDIAVEWHPNGESATIGRRYTDERFTRGYQLYQVDAVTGEATTLLYDEAYSHHFFTWDDSGDNLLLQRVPLGETNGVINNNSRPQIWVLNTEEGQLTQVADSAYLPRWINP